MKVRLRAGHTLRLLVSGDAFFDALVEAVDRSRREVLLDTYIFADDSAGRRVADALARAARRGVWVRVLVDGVGSRGFESGLGETLARAGAEVLTYRPVSLLRPSVARARRLHRKLVCVDGAVAFVGGINVVDDRDDDPERAPRLDFAVRVEGPLVSDVRDTMVRLWRVVRWARLRRRPAAPPALPTVPRPATRGGARAGLALRDQLRHRRDIEDAYLAAFADARNEILLANAYFLPGRRLRRALCGAASRGVSVRLLLQGRSDHPVVQTASRALYDELLASGVRVFEHDAGELHAKACVVDRDWATVGSSNLDPLSLLLAREANVVVRDLAFAGALADALQAALATGAREIRAHDLARTPWIERASSRVLYGLVRAALAMTPFRRES